MSKVKNERTPTSRRAKADQPQETTALVVARPKGTKKPTASLVPLDEQLTEVEVLVREVLNAPIEGEIIESSGDLAVNPTPHPWDAWPTADFLETKMSHLSVRPRTLDNEGTHQEWPPTMEFAHETANGPKTLGEVTRRGLENLALHVFMPVEFVSKLSIPTASAVITERIKACPDRPLVLACEAGKIVNLAFKHHEMLPQAEVASIAWDSFNRLLPGAALLDHKQGEGAMMIRIGTPRLEREVTTRKGDILQFGIVVNYGYGEKMKVALHTSRLVCLNGMIADGVEWQWHKSTECSADHQRDWLRAKVEEMIPKFSTLVERASLMAGNMLSETLTIRELAEQVGRANGFQLRHVPSVVDAWNAMMIEEEDVVRSEWHMLNAWTRAATHDERLRPFREDIQTRAGTWLAGNEIVTARLRRNVAERVHAEIIPDVA